ncbi:MAG: hypothetical protein FVQ81_13280 [Candidatus Glassbacteria bacterium]|nr:hypothetical protein [Candidatus Glassbacteria bacterium]
MAPGTREVIVSQHVKFDGTLFAPGEPCGLPDDLAERLTKEGRAEPAQLRAADKPVRSPIGGKAASSDTEDGGASAETLQFTDAQRKMLLKAAMITMVKDEVGLTGKGLPNVADLEEISGVNTDAKERDALFAEVFPEPDDGGEKKPGLIDRFLGKGASAKPEKGGEGSDK